MLLQVGKLSCYCPRCETKADAYFQELFFPGHISSDGRIKVTADNVLAVTDVRPADEGNYVCAAMNVAGSSLTKAALRVASKSKLYLTDFNKIISSRSDAVIDHSFKQF